MTAKTLFVGGARSGKSRLALATAERHAGPLHYLATAEIGDAEMAERIAMHQAERSARWQAVECPLDLPEAISARSKGVILVDCLTLWLSNLMLGGHPIERRSEDLLAAIAATQLPLVIVTNEVGLGIVPAHPLGREFRDVAGRLNQKVAARMDAAYFIVSGMVLPLHKFG